jgi:hypothetical protein
MMASLDLMVMTDCPEQQAQLAQQEQGESEDLLVHLAQTVPLEHKEIRETQV